MTQRLCRGSKRLCPSTMGYVRRFSTLSLTAHSQATGGHAWTPMSSISMTPVHFSPVSRLRQAVCGTLPCRTTLAQKKRTATTLTRPSSPMKCRSRRNAAITSITGVKFGSSDMKRWSRGKELRTGPSGSPVAFVHIAAVSSAVIFGIDPPHKLSAGSRHAWLAASVTAGPYSAMKPSRNGGRASTSPYNSQIVGKTCST